jgi:asparagine synthase (glutamine-hydrolysing)
MNKISIILNEEKYKIYTRHNIKIFFLGNPIFNEKFYDDNNELINYLSSLNLKNIDTVMNSIDGFYSIIIEKENEVYLISDRVCSIPFFYTINRKGLIVSDFLQNIIAISNKSFNQNHSGILEFLLCGFVTNNKTLLRSIYQSTAGEIVIYNKINNRIERQEYFRYLPKYYQKSIDIDSSIIVYHKIMKKTFSRLKDYIFKNNLIPVVPLSGGNDSRLLALLLKQENINNVITYTFGTEEHIEVITSKSIAERLDFEWHFVPYTKVKWYEEYNDEIIEEYSDFASNYSVKPHFMDFIAVKEIFKNREEKYLFLPGHTLDFIAGGHIPESLIQKYNPNKKDLINAIISKHFTFHSIYQVSILKIKKAIRRTLGNITLNDKNDIISAFEYWDWKERQAKFIMNSLNVYKYFKFDWYLPFWEKEWMSFFMSLPVNWRYKQNFERYALCRLFPDFFIDDFWYDENNVIVNETKYNVTIKNIIKELVPDNIKKHIKYKLLKKAKSTPKKIYDYGLERYGAFDPKIENLQKFYEKYIFNTDIKMIFFFFTKDYLDRKGFTFKYLNRKYNKDNIFERKIKKGKLK